MPSNEFQNYTTDLQAQANLILAAFTNAQAELASQSAPNTVFLEIAYNSGKIIRLYDNAQVITLPDSEQARLYPQLKGLFKLAINAVLLP